MATLSIALVLVAAALAVLSLSSGTFTFDDWPTAPDAPARERVVQIDVPVSATPEVRADARKAPRQTQRQAADLVAAVPAPPARERRVTNPQPVVRETTPQAPEAGVIPPAPEPDAPLEPIATPEPLLPDALPSSETELPAKDLPDLPGELSHDPAPSWIDPQLARRSPKGESGHGRD